MDARKSNLFLYIFFTSVFTLAINGCSRPTCSRYLTHEPIVQPKWLVKKLKPVPVIQRREYDLCLLKTHGVQVIRLGQTWKFILPSDDVFYNDTADINDNYKQILDVLVDFMRTYSKISVKVGGFSDKVADDVMTKFGTVTQQLTERQANAVAKYLTKRGANARLMYAVGYGNSKPVAWNKSPVGRRLNRRVEVSFRYYRDNTAWY